MMYLAGMPLGRILSSMTTSTVSSLTLFLLLFVFHSRVNSSPLLCLDHFSCQHSDQKKNVACRDNGIDIVPLCLNPSLVSLALHNTRIHTLYLTSFRYYGDLKYVNLSQNRINKIEKRTFECQANLEELHLAENKISHLEPEIFEGLKHLNVFTLSGNLLEEIPDGVFQHIPNLEHLDLTHNRITAIASGAFGGLTHLTVLLLSQNRLGNVPTESLRLVPHIAEFSVGGNKFTSFQKPDFEPLTHLTSLDLSNIDFSGGIVLDALEYVKDIRSLILNDCQLDHVPTEAMDILASLETLELSRNLFSVVPQGAFRSNKKLQSLTVTGNPHLERIAPGAFRDNLNLVRADLSRNADLTYLPPEDFRFLTRLSLLDLHGNNLQYIPHNMVAWNDVTTWHLHDNPLTCNCSSSWLRKMLIERNRTFTVDILCFKPPELSGVSLADTHVKDLLCGLDSATQGAVIALSICSLLLIIACVAFFLLYRNRGSCVQQLLKGQKWSRNRRNSHPRSYDSDYPCIKPVPVTEL